VLKADGRDTRGAGNASALITATAEPSGDRTKVTVATDLTVTGKVAQFGRGVMADVSAKLMGQFADNLEKLLEAESAPAAAPAAAAAAAATTETPAATTPVGGTSGNGAASAPTTIRKIESPEPEAVDLLDTAGAPVIKRLAPVLVLVLVLFLLRRKFRQAA
jgi:hypothetical protein